MKEKMLNANTGDIVFYKDHKEKYVIITYSIGDETACFDRTYTIAKLADILNKGFVVPSMCHAVKVCGSVNIFPFYNTGDAPLKLKREVRYNLS